MADGAAWWCRTDFCSATAWRRGSRRSCCGILTCIRSSDCLTVFLRRIQEYQPICFSSIVLSRQLIYGFMKFPHVMEQDIASPSQCNMMNFRVALLGGINELKMNLHGKFLLKPF